MKTKNIKGVLKIAEGYVSIMKAYLSLFEDRARGEKLPRREEMFIPNKKDLQIQKEDFNYHLDIMKRSFSLKEINEIRKRYDLLEKRVYEFIPNESKGARRVIHPY